MRIVSADIGGTSVKLGMVDVQGNIENFQEYDTESIKGGPYVLQTLIKKISQFEKFDGIGISTLGQVDRERGMLTQEASNIPQTNGLQIKSTLEEHFQVPVYVENDVNAAALGENSFGVGKNYSDFLYITYGTGVGRAIVNQSEIFYGKEGYAAEFGHMVTHAFGRKCGCGQFGCYETYASTTALVNTAKKLDSSNINGRIIFEKFHAGHEEVIEIVHDWMKEIVVGLASLIHIFNPGTIILGGGIMEQEVIVKGLNDLVDTSILDSFRGVELITASLGNKA